MAKAIIRTNIEGGLDIYLPKWGAAISSLPSDAVANILEAVGSEGDEGYYESCVVALSDALAPQDLHYDLRRDLRRAIAQAIEPGPGFDDPISFIV